MRRRTSTQSKRNRQRRNPRRRGRPAPVVTPEETGKRPSRAKAQARIWSRKVGRPLGRLWRQRKLTARQALNLAPTPLVSDDGYELTEEDWQY